MIGLDTNVLVRFLTGDDPEQSGRASDLVDSLRPGNPGYVSEIVLVETFWVLRRLVRLSPAECADVLEPLVTAADIAVRDLARVLEALEQCRAGHDLADALIAAEGIRAGCTTTVTFDRRAGRLSGMSLL